MSAGCRITASHLWRGASHLRCALSHSGRGASHVRLFLEV
ncbi:hypothetical protein J0P97_02080 [Microbacterium flavum]|uniref:Uncharacterized protein n=1 Tax=Microbacterium flavum TaxID=415216 RepID=A0ABS5XUR5_9MICO|nr:hypothetical protein [Microbacterium flavum]